MKKYLLIIFCAVIMFAVTGCGSKNQVVCTGTMTEGEEEVKVELTADFDKDDKLTTVTMTEDLGDKDKANQVCGLYEALSSQMPEGVSVSCSGSKVTIKAGEAAEGYVFVGWSVNGHSRIRRR